MQGFVKFEEGLCSCGWHESLTNDKANHFTFEDRVCPVCAGVAQYGRVLAERDEVAEKRLGEKAPARAKRPGDGRRTFTKMLGPDET